MCRPGRPEAAPCAKCANISWPAAVSNTPVPAFTRNLLLLLLPAVAALAANSTISSSKPVINFRLPAFTAEGHRAWLVRAPEARYVSPQHIDMKELTLPIFTGQPNNATYETIILTPPP